MARTVLTPDQALGSYQATLQTLTMTAADTSNQNACPLTGGEILIIHNTDASPHNVTITSVADPYNRTGTLTNIAVPAGAYCFFGPFELTGWLQTDGRLYFQADHAGVKFGIIDSRP